jgi:hypothetical protein
VATGPKLNVKIASIFKASDYDLLKLWPVAAALGSDAD